MLGDFLDESGQLLDRLNENMLQLDEWFRSLDDPDGHHCDLDLLNEMFRSAHSLKGLSAMLGLTDINQLTHKIENVFDAARKDELPLNCEVVELMFQSIDRLVGLVGILKEPNQEPVDCTEVIEGIHRVLSSAGVEKAMSSQADAEKALEQLPTEATAEVPAATETASAAAVSETAEICPPPIATESAAATEIQEPAAISPAVEVDHFEGITDEADLTSKYISIFIDETELSLDSLTELLLAQESDSHKNAIEQLLITSHRIKGSAASIGLNRVAKLAHLMEDLMQDISSGEKTLSPETSDALLACIDGLRTYVDGLKSGNPRTSHFNGLACNLLGSLAVENVKNTEAKTDSTPAEAIAPPAASDRSDNARIDDTVQARIRKKINEAEWNSAIAGVVTFQPRLALAGLKGRLLYEKLANLGEVRYFSPAVDKLEELDEIPSVEFGLITEKPLESVRKVLHIGGVSSIDLEPLAKETPASVPVAAPVAKAVSPVATAQPVAKPAPAAKSSVEERETADSSAKSNKPAAADNSAKPTETLRVDIERLDQLMNLAGQLVINKARFQQIGDKLKKTISGRQSRNVLNNVNTVLAKMAESGENGIQQDLDTIRGQARRLQQDMEEIRRDLDALAAVRGTVNDLFETIHLLDRVSDGIQQSVMDTRMLPIGPLFQRFKRVIRDISRSNGKNIRLDINGEKTELDKRMIDELGDPLIHMVRNSADHGIESPEVRLAAGKPEQGTVSLDAFHRGNSIYIRVCDDGKGLDSERIKAKALERGLISQVEAERMTKQQIFQLIWEPGLSTAEKVTEVSGRGMGMDIVKSKIELLNGTVELDSEMGKGTTVTIKLPLTLAILPSLMVSIDGDIFAMPLESVVEIINVSPKDISTIHRQPTARVRGRVVSMVELCEVFSWHQGGARSQNENAADNPASTLVIINENGSELGLAVDHVIGEQDIVIKSMAENYRNVQGVAGASILGDGRVSLILDLVALIDMATSQKVKV
jgi:two-component system chemotaxis sensor kinase CheA